MRRPIIAGILILLTLYKLSSEQARIKSSSDELLEELLKELKLYNNKKSNTENIFKNHPGFHEVIENEDNSNNMGYDVEIIEDTKSEGQKSFNSYEDLENNILMSNTPLNLPPLNKFYGDDPNVDPCGSLRPRVISDPHGTIKSPGYGINAYGNNLICSWKFEAPPDEVVELTVTVMNIESNQECKYDNLEIFDVVDRKGISLGKYCGSELPMELLQSSEQLIFLYFITDDDNDAGRFEVKWRMVSPKVDEPSIPSCGRPAITPNVNQRIVNGQPAAPFSWPWMVSIRIFKDGQWDHNCGGSILREDVVVTAAHCFYDPANKKLRPLNEMRIVAGEYDEKTTTDGPTQTISIKVGKVHEKYNQLYSSSPYDIAIIILDGKLKFNNHIQPICLPREAPKLTSLCYVTGWGDTYHTGDRTVLNQVRLPIVNHNTCKRGDYYGIHMLDSMICAGYEEGGKDACQRDSGGPLECYNPVNDRWYLQGLASWGIGCAKPMKPGVYTRVIPYINWIFDACGVRQ